MTTRSVVVGLAVAAGVFLAGCSGDSVAPNEARLRATGDVRVATGDGAFVSVTGARTLKYGDRVRVRDGSAHILTANGASLALARDTELRVESEPDLVRGHLLVTTAARHPVTVRTGPAKTETQGVTHLTRQLASSVSTYKGRATMRSAGRSLEVPALREATVPALGLLPARPTPISYDADDRWDRRFLSPAIEFGDQLEALSRGLEAQIPVYEGRTPGFYRTLLPQLDREADLDSLLDPDRPRGENLVGAAIAAAGGGGSFAERWTTTFAFRDEGAHWGLVALDQDAMSARLADTLQAAIARTPTEFAAAPGAVSPGLPGTGPVEGGGPAPTGTPSGGTNGPTSPTAPVTDGLPVPVPPAPPAPEGLLPTLVQTVDETADAVVGGLLGAVGGAPK